MIMAVRSPNQSKAAQSFASVPLIGSAEAVLGTTSMVLKRKDLSSPGKKKQLKSQSVSESAEAYFESDAHRSAGQPPTS
jgi:hypothetical protein